MSLSRVDPLDMAAAAFMHAVDLTRTIPRAELLDALNSAIMNAQRACQDDALSIVARIRAAAEGAALCQIAHMIDCSMISVEGRRAHA